MLGECWTKLLTSFCVAHGFVERASRHATGSGADAGAKGVHSSHRQEEAIAFGADHILRRNAATFECNFTNRMRRDHRSAFNYTKAGHLGAHYKRRKRGAAIGIGAGAREHGVEIGHPSIRDKTFAAVDHVSIAIAPRRRLDS